MAASLIDLARFQLHAAEQELRKLPQYQEVERLRAFLSVYEDLERQQRAVEHRAVKAPAESIASAQEHTSARPAAGLAKESKKDLITNAAVSLLEARFPQTSADLLYGMENMRVQVGGADPLVNLSAYLSKSGLFVHKRKLGGWFLKHQLPVENPRPDQDGG